MQTDLTPIASAVQASGLPAAMFDYRLFLEQLEGEYEVKHPLTGKPTGWKLRIAGVEHPMRKKRGYDRRREVTAEMARTGRVPVIDPQAADEANTEDLISFTLGWEGGAEPYSTAAVRAAFSSPQFRWLRDQVTAALDDRSLFIVDSAAS